MKTTKISGIAGRARLHAEFSKCALILAGCLAMALGVTLFLQPNQIASGGTPGIAILLCHLTGLTTGAAMLLINIPLLLTGCYFLGQGFVWRTVVTVLLVSGLVDLLNELVSVGALTSSPLVAAIGGGAAIGLGVGLVLRSNASAGGPTIIARIIASRTSIRPGQILLVIDIAIVLSSALVFGALQQAFWSLLSVVVTGRCIDLAFTRNWSKRLDEIRYYVARAVTSF